MASVTRSQLRLNLCRCSSVILLQFPAQYLSGWGSRYLHATSSSNLARGRYQLLTSSTACIPPRNHLCLLSRERVHSSSAAKTASAPCCFPRLESTTHARGTSSSDRRSPFTPATAMSVISWAGCSKIVSSISVGETWLPETLRVS